MAGQQVGAAAAAYARHKQNHQQTALACGAQGVAFVPMVAEATVTGTWDSSAAAVIKHVARAVAARAGEEPSPLHSLLLQELCMAVRSHRARAALRRRLAASEGL